MAGCGSTAAGTGGNDSVDGDRAGGRRSCSSARSVRTRGFGRGVDGEDGAVVLEVEGVALLIGREEGAVHEDAAVNEV